MQILYFVHDLNDSAVHRRAAMLRAGGADLALAGFRRGAAPLAGGVEDAIVLGATRDAAFGQRVAAVLKAGATLGARLARVPRPDVIIARNLEMLALANRARAVFGGDIPIVYECLDLHRLMLDAGPTGAAMRWTERLLAANASLLITSSPAFVRNHLGGQVSAPVELIENKVLELGRADANAPSPIAPPAGDEPWLIGWYGILRCRRSFQLLADFTRKMEGRFLVELRGKPARTELPDFDARVAAEPFMRFGGAYRGSADLADLYSGVHLTWTIDFFEEGQNSEWLLPNRLYEGCRFGSVPIALAHTETGRFLRERKLGLLVDSADPAGIAQMLSGLDRATYLAARAAIEQTDRRTWIADRADCAALVERLRTIAGRAGNFVLAEAIP